MRGRKRCSVCEGRRVRPSNSRHSGGRTVDNKRAVDGYKCVVGGSKPRDHRSDGATAHRLGRDGRARVGDGTRDHRSGVAGGKTVECAGKPGVNQTVVGFDFGICCDFKHSLRNSQGAVDGGKQVIARHQRSGIRRDNITADISARGGRA